ncbi:MAG: cation:proton antiporter [Acidimicrobiales bacterium]
MLADLDEHELLVFWTQVLVLVGMARLCGALMRRINLPSVIGQLAAGVILGPSIFGRVWPDGFHWFLPDDDLVGALLAVSWLGVALLLVTAGFETDLGLIRRWGGPPRSSPGSASSCAAARWPRRGGGSFRLVRRCGERPDGVRPSSPPRSVSALAVIAKILSELGLMRRDFGQITVAAGMANDVVGWVMLAIFTGFAASGSVSVSVVLRTVVGLAAFLLLAMTVGQRAVDLALRVGPPRRRQPQWCDHRRDLHDVDLRGGHAGPRDRSGAGCVRRRRGVAPVEVPAGRGGPSSSRSPRRSSRRCSSRRRDCGSISGFSARAARSRGRAWSSRWRSWRSSPHSSGAVGGPEPTGGDRAECRAPPALPRDRHRLGRVVARRVHETAYTVVVIVPLVTSIFAAVSLRIAVRDWLGSPEEVERLVREEALSRNLVVKSSRILLPSQGEPASIAAAQLVQFVWPKEAPATIVSVRPDGDWPDITVLEAVLDERAVDHRQVKGHDVAQSILAESRLGYGVIAVGVAARHEGQLYSPMVDELLLNATLPVVIVRRARGLDRPLPAAFGRVVVPVTGTASSRSAQEIAFSISSALGTEVVLTHILHRTSPLPRLFVRRGREDDPAMAVVDELVAAATALASESGVRPRTLVEESATAGPALVQVARAEGADLVVLGARLRNVDGRPFLGHTVETVLEQSDATVVVVAHPRSTGSEPVDL